MSTRTNDESSHGAREEISDAADGVADAVSEAGQRFERVGRAGWVAKGIVYALIGTLFIRIAAGTSQTDEANQAGAVEQIASTVAGAFLVGALAIGLTLYLLWRLLTVVLPGDWTGRALLDRIGYAVSAAVYGSLLITTVGILRRRNTSADQDEDRRVEALVKNVLDMTAGRTLVAISGAVFLAIAGVFAHKGWSRSFRSDMSGSTGLEDTMIDRLGMVGWTARGVSMGLIGIFLIRAAWLFDSDEAAGLDDSIRQVASNPAGAVLAGLVGVGFVVYGAFAIASARHRDLDGPRNSDTAQPHDAKECP